MKNLSFEVCSLTFWGTDSSIAKSLVENLLCLLLFVTAQRGKKTLVVQFLTIIIIGLHFFKVFLFFYFIYLLKNYLFIYLFIYLAALGLGCWVRAFSSCGEQGLLFVVVRGLLIAVASLVVEHGL